MSGYLHITAPRAHSRPCMVSSLNVTWSSGATHMSIFVRSLFPTVGWHDRSECPILTIITSACWVPISVAVGSQLTMSHVSVKKNPFQKGHLARILPKIAIFPFNFAICSFQNVPLGFHFLSPFGPSFPFILAYWAFISFHFGLLNFAAHAMNFCC